MPDKNIIVSRAIYIRHPGCNIINRESLFKDFMRVFDVFQIELT